VIQHGKQLLEGLPCLLRFHFALTLTRLNCTSWRGDRAIPIRLDVFLALAEVYAGGSRSDAARIGGVGLQIVRDWVLRFNAEGPGGLLNGKAPGVTTTSAGRCGRS
jgi:Winged helix-turn helix